MKFEIPVPDALLAAALSVALMLTACGGGEEDSRKFTQRVYGEANLGTPLVGARVEIVGARGQTITASGGATDASGTFVVELPSSGLTNFRVKATGGVHDGKPFDSQLLLDVEGFDPTRDTLDLNAVTTLITRYIDRHPGTTVEAASTRVKAFLQIPASSRAGFDVSNPKQNYFRHERLFAAMQAAGVNSLATYIDGLVSEIDSGAQPRSFARPPLLGGIIEDITVEALLKFLGTSVANQGVGLVFNKAINALGLGGNSEVLEQLKIVNQKLDELKALSAKIFSEAKKTQFDLRAEDLIDDTTLITSQFDALTKIANRLGALQCKVDSQGPASDPSCTPDQKLELRQIQNDIAARRKVILDVGKGGIAYALAKIDTVLMNQNELSSGLLSAARDYTKSTLPFDAPLLDQRLIHVLNYYQIQQAMGTQLLVEANEAEVDQNGKLAPNTFAAKDALATITTRFDKQGTYVAGLRRGGEKEGTVLDQRTNLVWLQAPVSKMEPLRSRATAEPNYPWAAKDQCEKIGWSNFGGYGGWRVPTGPELRAVVKGSPNPTGNAHAGKGIFNWLIQQGFSAAPNNGQSYQRGFLPDNATELRSLRPAYFSSTDSDFIGLFKEVLRDDGVYGGFVYARSPYDDTDSAGFATQVGDAGVWCVTQAKSAGE